MDSYIDDLSYYDTSSDGFKNYEANTYDPGPWMTTGVCLYSIMCVLVFLPLSVVVGKMCTKTRITRSSNDVYALNKKKTNSNSSISSLFFVRTKTSGDDDCPSSYGIEIHSRDLMQQSSRQHEKQNSKEPSDETIDLEEEVTNSLKDDRKTLSDRRMVEENEAIVVDFDSSRQLQEVSLTTIKAEDKSVSEIIIPMAVVEETSMVSGSSDEQHSKENSIKPFVPAFKTTYNRKICYPLSKIISCDKETVRILKLGGPFTISSLSDSVFDAIILAIVSKYLGVQSLSAMVVTHLLVGLTDTFIKGVADTLDTLCPHAVGTDNYTLAGQYAQIAVGMYTIVSLPVAAAWWFLMDDAIRLFGMNEAVVIIGHDYSKVMVGECFVTGIYHALFTLLDVSGYASHASLLLILEGTISVLTVWGLLHGIEDMNLFWVGVTRLCICSLVYLFFAIFVVYKGWLNPFWHGLTKTFAFKNIQAVKNVVGTAMPLALGTLLEYGEWEALTFFAAALGPAEVVAWGILESIWELFEAATEGLAEAGSMRLALHLGRGDIPTSKLSSWKTLFLSTVLACTLSSILLILSPYIPRWFTDDTTLIKMVEDQLPLIGFGNIFMVFGMTSWSLIGAQGRYKIATLISATMTLFITLPLAALFCIGLRYSLISLVGAVVVGYSTTGLCLGYLLQMSDWEHISKNICDLNETFDMDSSSSEEEDSNSDDDDDDDGDVFVDNA